MLCGALLLTAPLAGCTGGGPVELDTPALDGADRTACEALAADLPATLADHERRDVEPSDALGAAYGDPALTVTCGVAVPSSFSATSECIVVDGVGWYAPPDEVEDPDADVHLTTAGYRPVLGLTVPGGGGRGDDTAAALADLSGVVDDHLRLVDACD